MDHLRVLQVPFNPTCLILVAIASVLITFFAWAGLYGMLGVLILQIWIFKYCYALIEHLANGRPEVPVMSTDMLSPFEIRPGVQAVIIFGAGTLCWSIGGRAGFALGILFLIMLPA